MPPDPETLNSEIRHCEAFHRNASRDRQEAIIVGSPDRRNEQQARELLGDLYERQAQLQAAKAPIPGQPDTHLSESERRIYHQAYWAGHAAGRLEIKLHLINMLGDALTDH